MAGRTWYTRSLVCVGDDVRAKVDLKNAPWKAEGLGAFVFEGVRALGLY